MFLTETEKSDIGKSIQFFFQNRKILFFSCIIGSLLAAVISFISPPKYRSKTLIFAVSYADLEKNQTNMPFGLDLHADQLTQILTSNRLKDSLIQHFKLEDYYKINKNTKDWREQVYKNWEQDVNIHKTRFLSIEITVETKQAQLSADIANGIVSYGDKIYNEILDENKQVFLQNTMTNYKKQQADILKLTDSLAVLTIQKKDTFLTNLLKKNIRSMSEFLNGDLKKQYDFANTRFNKKTKVLSIIDIAVPAGRKSSPSYSLNILLGATLGLIFTILGKLLILLYKKMPPFSL